MRDLCAIGLAGLAGLLLAAGCGGNSTPNCQTGAEVFRICQGDVLFECPVGSGERVEMTLVQDCGATGLVCDESAMTGGSCLDPDQIGHLVGDDAFAYSEAAEADNSTKAGSEDTGYTLDATGIRISGTLEAGTATSDYFRFHTGTFGRIDVQAFVDGEKSGIQLGLDAFADDGYSTLNGSGYFINAWIQPGMSYVISVYPAEAGASYTLEMRGAS